VLLLALGLVGLAAYTALGLTVATAIHAQIHPGETLREASGFWPGVSAVAAVFFSIPLALVTANALIWHIPSARRALEFEAQGLPKASYRSSQRTLRRCAAWLSGGALVLLVVGAAFPW
jgi:hypothetical protein